MRCASFAGLNGGDFEKRSVPKPARIPPQTPPAGGKSAEAGRIHSPRQIVSPCRVRISSFNHLDFARNSFELCPTNTAKWENASFGKMPSPAVGGTRLGFERAFLAKRKRIYQSKYGSSRFVFRFFGSLECSRLQNSFCPPTHSESRTAWRGANSVRANSRIHRQLGKQLKRNLTRG